MPYQDTHRATHIQTKWTSPTMLCITTQMNLPSPSVIQEAFLAGIRTHERETLDPDDGTRHFAIHTLESLHSVTWERVRQETASDDDMHQLTCIIEDGMPTSPAGLPSRLWAYHRFQDDLHVVDGVILYKDCIVIPPSLHKDTLSALHASHQGVSSMIARAETSIFWPGISKAIRDKRNSCQECDRMAPSQPSAPPTATERPVYPFQCICADFFTYKGKNYLVIVDRYSNWPIVDRASDGAKGLIDCLRHCFTTYGIPDELASDGGPEFTATSTKSFLRSWGVQHRLSSTAFPHSNCRAEIGVKTAKRMLTENTGPYGELDTDRFQRAMLQYRNTPRS